MALQILEDVDRLLERLEELKPVIAASSAAIETLEVYRNGLEAVTDHAKASAVNYIIEHTNAVAASRRDELLAALEQATVEAWRGTASKRLDQVAGRIGHALELAGSSRRLVPVVLTALTSCAVGVAIGGTLAVGLLHHV